MASFWENLGPGLLQTGANYYLGQRASREAEDRLRRAQGPLYDTQMGLAGESLRLAKGMDPNALAADRFKQQQALVASTNQAQVEELMRILQKRGQSGIGSFGAVPGTVATPGVAMNPQLAALFAAQQGGKERAAYQSLEEGQRYLDQLLERGGMLQRGAQEARASGQEALGLIPRKPSLARQVLPGAVKVLGDPKARTEVFQGIKNLPALLKSGQSVISGLFGDGVKWIGDLFR